MTQIAPSTEIPDYSNDDKIPDIEQISPLKILDDAAARMTQQTGNLVHAEVYLAPFLGTIRYTFYLVIPSLNGYTDPLFYVWTSSPNRGYPVYLLESGAEQSEQIVCDNADKLALRLGDIFGSSWAKSRIRQWMEMAKERGVAR